MGARYPAGERPWRIAIGRQIGDARRELGLSQAEVGAALHVSRSMVAMIELGNCSPSGWMLVQLVELLGIDCLPAPATNGQEHLARKLRELDQENRELRARIATARKALGGE